MAKKEKEYTFPKAVRRTKEQKEFSPVITEYLIPLFLNNIDIIKSIGSMYRDDHCSITKEQWNSLYNIMLELCNTKESLDKMHDGLVSADKLQKFSYKLKHSNYYYVVADAYIKYMLSHIERGEQYDITDEKQFHYYTGAYYTAMLHLYYFLTSPEKI